VKGRLLAVCVLVVGSLLACACASGGQAKTSASSLRRRLRRPRRTGTRSIAAVTIDATTGPLSIAPTGLLSITITTSDGDRGATIRRRWMNRTTLAEWIIQILFPGRRRRPRAYLREVRFVLKLEGA
jgi:hypothetical protein